MALSPYRLRDWGETNYNIVRNWTPHNKKLAPLSSSLNKSEASVTKFSPAKKLPSSTKVCSAQTSFQGEVSTSYRLRRSSRKQQSATRSESSWYIPDDPTANRGSLSFRSFKQNHRDRSGLLNDEIGKSEQIHSDAHSSSMSSSESPNGAHLSLNYVSDTSDHQFSSNSKVHVASLEDESYGGDMCEGKEQGAPVQRPGNEDVDGDEGGGEAMANEEGTSDADPMDCEDNMDTDALLPPSSKKSADSCTVFMHT